MFVKNISTLRWICKYKQVYIINQIFLRKIRNKVDYSVTLINYINPYAFLLRGKNVHIFTNLTIYLS